MFIEGMWRLMKRREILKKTWLIDEKNEGMRNTEGIRSPLKFRETSVEVQFQPGLKPAGGWSSLLTNRKENKNDP